MIAATCFSTFDVSPEHVSALLADDEDFSVAMRCAIVVYNNTPSSLSDEDSFYLTRMLSRHRRLLHDLEPMFGESDSSDLGQVRLSHSGAYNLALTWLGLSYHNSSSWHALPRPDSQWISCVTERGQKVHYDLLTGQLLIDGKQLGRLPREMVEHPTYASILGTVSDQSRVSPALPVFLTLVQKIFDVAPADIPGIDYMTRSTVSGYQVGRYSCLSCCRRSD
jgi:hypothetical protein